MNFPYSIDPLEKSSCETLKTLIQGHSSDYVQVGSDKWILEESYKDFAEEIYNFEARSDDVFVCTFPRSGTTWTQEMVWLICNDLNYEEAMNKTLHQRVPYFEFHLLYPTKEKMLTHPSSKGKSDEELMQLFGPKYKAMAKITSQRFIKTHLPMKLLPRNIKEVGAKVVYVARNPKDVAVSNFHLLKDFCSYDFADGFDSFVELFTEGLIAYGPFWKHVLDGWSHRNDPNVFFMFYEDLKQDLSSTLRNLSKFLDKPLNDEDLPKLIDHLQFENVKKNPSINFTQSKPIFVRRGLVGGNPEITKEIGEKIDEWTKENLKDSDFVAPSC